MNNIESLLQGFASALTLTNLMFGLFGTILGTLVGVLPGIGPALAIALLLPITYSINPASALIMFAAIYYGAMYGGSTTSILLNTPGESGSVITALEGHQMAKRGRAGAALATAAIGSFVAGFCIDVSCIYDCWFFAWFFNDPRHGLIICWSGAWFSWLRSAVRGYPFNFWKCSCD
jgi:TctA family transporter